MNNIRFCILSFCLSLSVSLPLFICVPFFNSLFEHICGHVCMLVFVCERMCVCV